jgi:hypothetical protein
MDERIVSSHKLGVVFATFIGGWHIVWSLLVLLRWAQPVIDFVFWLHFITPPYRLEAFVAWRAIALILLATAVGYVVGRIVAMIWNWVH